MHDAAALEVHCTHSGVLRRLHEGPVYRGKLTGALRERTGYSFRQGNAGCGRQCLPLVPR
ncbi:hypothetical protein CLJ1_0941 [Pseudomonas paraeruginosa]|nr:hypothetical protein CLJ1_0941 [Pseudomonas aeruginosa]